MSIMFIALYLEVNSSCQHGLFLCKSGPSSAEILHQTKQLSWGLVPFNGGYRMSCSMIRPIPPSIGSAVRLILRADGPTGRMLLPASIPTPNIRPEIRTDSRSDCEVGQLGPLVQYRPT